MKVTLSPEEILHVLQQTIQYPHPDSKLQNSLLLKLRAPLIESLATIEEQQNVNLFRVWEKNESKKLDDLKNENLSIKHIHQNKNSLKSLRKSK